VGATAGRVFTAHEVETAQSFADHAALALDNAWLYQDAERRRREAEVIADIAATINAAEHLDIMLQRVAWGARELTVSDQALIALRDFASGEMRFRYWAGTLYTQMDAVLIEPGKGAGGIVMVTGQPVRTSDYAADPKLSKEYVDIATADSIVALLVVPIKIVGRVEGLIYVGNRTKRAFTDHDETSMVRLADHAGIAIRNFRHLSREREARAEAEAASRMKDEFLANLSHELRTPLTAVLGWARLVRSAKLDTAGLERALDTIERNAQAQAQIVEDLLDVSRIITGKLRLDSQPADLPQIIEAALDSVRPAAEAKAITLTTDLDRTLRRVPADAARIQQVVWNLLANALKFTPRGGRISVTLARAGDEVRITVSDTGVGIRPEFLPHVFERFSQADPSTTRKHGGLGLGLAIVRHLVELHGGVVEANSAGEGQGATFAVILPLQTGTVRQGAMPGRPARRSGGARGSASELLEDRRVLIVDDDADSRELFSSVLRSAGAHVWTVASVREGLEMLDSITPDVLVADIGMPDQDGYDLIRRVRALPAPLGRVPAVAVTAYAGPRDHERALATGYNAHIPKPVEPDQLRRIVARLCVRARAS
jgi:signal transduction histidine kinase/ActR/RegA family two-component response regulator